VSLLSLSGRFPLSFLGDDDRNLLDKEANMFFVSFPPLFCVASWHK
jgi:hypothetical protein